MREPLRFSWRHWWNLILVLIFAAGVTAWTLRLVDGRIVLAAVLLWIVVGAVAAPSIIQEHMAFTDRWVFHDYDKARLRYRRAVDSGKATPQAYSALGSLCHAEGDLAEASALLEEAMVKRPGDAHLLMLLSKTLSAEGRHEEAVAAAIRCQETGGKQPLPDMALADALKAKGDQVAAASAYQKAIKVNPKLLDCRVNLASIYLSMGETKAAEDEVREALKISPGHPDALYWAGHVEAAKGDRESATSYFRSALRGRPVDDQSLRTPYADMVRAAARPTYGVPPFRYGPQDTGLRDQASPSPGKEIR